MSAEYILVRSDGYGYPEVVGHGTYYLQDSYRDIWTTDRTKAERWPDRFYLTGYARRCTGVVHIEKA